MYLHLAPVLVDDDKGPVIAAQVDGQQDGTVPMWAVEEGGRPLRGRPHAEDGE